LYVLKSQTQVSAPKPCVYVHIPMFVFTQKNSTIVRGSILKCDICQMKSLVDVWSAWEKFVFLGPFRLCHKVFGNRFYLLDRWRLRGAGGGGALRGISLGIGLHLEMGLIYTGSWAKEHAIEEADWEAFLYAKVN